MGEVVRLPRRPRPEPEPPWRPPAAPAVALPRTGVLGRPAGLAATDPIDLLIEWQPRPTFHDRLRRFFR